MTSLPPGWAADYDGKRWFFTYGPTGQSQFQFPRPGDEFPDFVCCAGGGSGAFLPAVELMPEERLESERQVRRQLNVAGSGPAGSTGKVVDEKGRGRGRVSPVREVGGGGNAVCFESFATVGSRRGEGLSANRQGTGTTEQRERLFGDGVGIPARTSIAEATEGSTGKPVSVQPGVNGKHAQAIPPPPREACSTATIAIMSEPVLAVVETTATAPSLGDQDQHQHATVAQPSPHELPVPDDRVVVSTQTPRWASSVGAIPELHSESTALCEVEINPPPVELPGHEGGWTEYIMVSNSATQGAVELPAYEGPYSIPQKGSITTELEPESCVATTPGDDHAATSNAGMGQTPRGKSNGHDRAGLPSQVSRILHKTPCDETFPKDNVNSDPDREPPTGDIDQPAEMARAEWMDLKHFPSVLRPGPRWSGQLPLRRAGPAMSAPITDTSNAVRVQLHQPQEHRHRGNAEERGSTSQERLTRMPTMPPAPHPREVSATTYTAGPEAPQPGGARQNRLPGSVNFVIPIQHIPRAEPQSAPGSAEQNLPKYHVSASFASTSSPERPPKAAVAVDAPDPRPQLAASAPRAGSRSEGGGQAAGGGGPGLLPDGRTESRGRRAEEAGAPAHHFVGGRTAPEVPQWSWGYAR